MRSELEGMRINASRGGDWPCSQGRDGRLGQAELVAWLMGRAVKEALAESGIDLRHTKAETTMIRELRLQFLSRVFGRDIDSSLGLRAGEASAVLDLLDTHGILAAGRWIIGQE